MGEIFNLKELADDCVADKNIRFPARRARTADHRSGWLAGQPASDEVSRQTSVPAEAGTQS